MSVEIAKIINYNGMYWKNKMSKALSDEDKIKVSGEFAGIAIDAFGDGADTLPPQQLTKMLKVLNRFARSMVMSSDGICDGYRLVDNWFQIIVAQLTIHGGIADGDESRATKHLVDLYGAIGWDVESAIHPTHDALRTVIGVEYLAGKDGSTQSFNLLLEPTNEHPVGAQYVSKSGLTWTVCDYAVNSVMCEPSEELLYRGWNLMPFSSSQLKNMRRVV